MVTSLNIFLLSRLQVNVSFTTLLSITNPLLLELNQGLLGSSLLLNYDFVHCPYFHTLIFFLFLSFLCFYNSWLNVQNIITIPFIVYFYCIRILPRCESCLLIQVYNDCVCSFYSFY